jgi:methyltransferase (TIGR00027 family)
VPRGRAAHQLVDTPRVLDDPIALRIIGPAAAAEIQNNLDRENTRMSRAMRAFMAVRSRYAEDGLAQAVERGVTQYVLLGAGLDTFGYRNPFGDRLRVFEVDHPATQGWKRAQVEAAGIDVPSSLTYTPINFERQTIMDGLVASGFNPAAPAFFAWLGVTMYLARETVMATFAMIAALPKGSGVVFDYGIEPALLSVLERMVVAEFSRRVAAIGEPWTTFFDPSVLAADLGATGFVEVEDLSGGDINERYFKDRADGLAVGTLARLVRASTAP